MKMRRIPEIDLARTSGQPLDVQKRKLRGHKGFRPTHTLNPFRKVLGDIANLQFDMFEPSDKTSWKTIKSEINNNCSKGNLRELKYNLAIARAVYDYFQTNDVMSFSKPTIPWGVGYGNSVSYWNNFYSIIDGKATFIFFDPRLSSHLTGRARKFAFSMMHQRLRVADPDFEDANLLIAQFNKTGKWERQIIFRSSDETEFYTEEELNNMISDTYKIWAEILFEREQESRRAVGDSNPFGF